MMKLDVERKEKRMEKKEDIKYIRFQYNKDVQFLYMLSL